MTLDPAQSSARGRSENTGSNTNTDEFYEAGLKTTDSVQRRKAHRK